MTRTLVVVNPASAGGRTLRNLAQIETALRRHRLVYERHLTSGAGDATDATRAALRDGFELIVAVGGDGTLNEVVNGFFDDDGVALGERARLGLIPSGTGGDFRRSVGIPRDIAASAGLLGSGRHRRVDAGRIDFAAGDRRFFVNVADCGIGGEVVAAVNRSRYKGGGARGSAVFLGISLRTLLTFKGRRVRVACDDDEPTEDDVESVVVGNGRYFGGGMRIAPDAAVDDGVFDVVVVAASGRLRALASLPSLYRGTHTGNPHVRIRRAARVTITGVDGDLLFDVEGEQIGRTPATLTCLPGAIDLCAPPAG